MISFMLKMDLQLSIFRTISTKILCKLAAFNSIEAKGLCFCNILFKLSWQLLISWITSLITYSSWNAMLSKMKPRLTRLAGKHTYLSYYLERTQRMAVPNIFLVSARPRSDTSSSNCNSFAW